MKFKLAPELFVKIHIPDFQKIGENVYSLTFCDRQTDCQGVGSLPYFVKYLKLFLLTQLATHGEYILSQPLNYSWQLGKYSERGVTHSLTQVSFIYKMFHEL
jgi:hypothetical protein